MSVRMQLVSAMVGVSVLSMLIAAGCGGGGTGFTQPTATPAATQGGATGRNAYFIPFTAANDVQYIDAIVPHHMHAIETSTLVIENGSNAAVKTLARNIISTQQQEIALLKAERKALTGNENVPPPPPDRHSMSDIARLRAARGAQADKEFLDNMIPHHGEGVSIAHRAYPNLRRPRVIANADDVYNTQAREIGQMIALRGNTTQTGRS